MPVAVDVGASMNVCCHSSSHSRFHRRRPWFTRPVSCSSIRRSTSGRVQLAALVHAPRQQRVVQQRAQLAAQPARVRDAEAALLPVEDVVGQEIAQRLAKQPLAAEAAHLEVRRHGRRELDQHVVDQRAAHLQRVLHRRDVDLGEDVVDEIRSACPAPAARPSASVAVASDSRRPNSARPASAPAACSSGEHSSVHLLGREVAELRGVARDVAHLHAARVRCARSRRTRRGTRLARPGSAAR